MLIHLDEYDSDDEYELLRDLQNLDLSPKPHFYYITCIGTDYSDAICIISNNLFEVASYLFKYFGIFDEVREAGFKKHVLEYRNLNGLLDHISDVMSNNFDNNFEFSVWELTPRNKKIPEGGIFETGHLKNPVRCYEMGNFYFSDFTTQLKEKPYGNL